ncbi:MAG: DegT/DnrJ/EryC1/StrS family aminotransferase [Acidobacteriota bacterium]
MSGRSQPRVPFIDLKAQFASVREAVLAAIHRVLDSQQFIGGEELEAFERRLASLVGVRHAVGCASGTDALLLALRAAGIGAGHEVVVPTFSFFSTASAVVMSGARPVFVDIEPTTFNLDPARLEQATAPELRAVVVAHLFGRMADVDRIRPWCEARGLILIEDAAQALGAGGPGGRAGGLGQAGCFSFFPTKNLGAYGDAGAIVTDDEALAGSLRSLRAHGRSGEYEHAIVGINSRLDTLQAAVLLAKLDFLEGWNRRRRQHAHRYGQLFAQRGLGEPASGLVTPPADDTERWIAHQYVVRVEGDRDRLRRYLLEHGIGCAVYYPCPLHRQPALAHIGRRAGSLAQAEQACRQALALPVYPELTQMQQDQVVEAVCQGLSNAEV